MWLQINGQPGDEFGHGIAYMVYDPTYVLVAGGGVGRVVGDGLVGVEDGLCALMADFVEEGDLEVKIAGEEVAVVQPHGHYKVGLVE